MRKIKDKRKKIKDDEEYPFLIVNDDRFLKAKEIYLY